MCGDHVTYVDSKLTRLAQGEEAATMAMVNYILGKVPSRGQYYPWTQLVMIIGIYPQVVFFTVYMFERDFAEKLMDCLSPHNILFYNITRSNKGIAAVLFLVVYKCIFKRNIIYILVTI